MRSKTQAIQWISKSTQPLSTKSKLRHHGKAKSAMCGASFRALEVRNQDGECRGVMANVQMLQQLEERKGQTNELMKAKSNQEW